MMPAPRTPGRRRAHVLAWASLLVPAALLFALGPGCGGSGGGGEQQADGPVGPAPAGATAGTTGVVALVPGAGSPSSRGAAQDGEADRLVIAPTLAEAGEGATPLEGADVRLVDRISGTEVASMATGPDGAFSFTDLDLVHASLAVRRPGADGVAAPELIEHVTFVRGELIPAARPFPVDRDEAVAAVLATVPDDALVACTQNPLPTDTLVFPAFGDDAGQGPLRSQSHVVQSAGEWFCWVDLDVGALFTHPVEFVFVDATTGTLTRSTQEWWPAVNHVLFYDDFRDLFRSVDQPILDPAGSGQLRVSLDVVQLGAQDLVDPAQAVEARVLAGSPVPPRAIATGAEPEDRFAILWGGVPESSIVVDLMRMNVWLQGQGIPEENILTLAYSPGFELFDLPNVRIIEGNTARELEANTAGVIREFGQMIQGVRDEGRHPEVFFFGETHGNTAGELTVFRATGITGAEGFVVGAIVVDPGELGLIHQFRADRLLPLAEIPACHLQVLVVTCRGQAHLNRWAPTFRTSDSDVEIYMGSGFDTAGHRPLSSEIRDELADAVGTGFGLLGDPAPERPIGAYMVGAWTAGATLADGGVQMEAELDGRFDDLDSIRRVVEREDGETDEEGRPLPDAPCFDPGRPDPCVLPELPPEPEPAAAIARDPISFVHVVRESPCPQEVGVITIRNTGNTLVQYTVTERPGTDLLGFADDDAPPEPLETEIGFIEPGESAEVRVFFECGTREDFRAAVQVEVRDSSGTDVVAREVVTVDGDLRTP